MTKSLLCTLVLTALCVSSFSGVILAEESAINKVKDGVGDFSTETKKTVRKGNRKVRKAVGADTGLKDAKDKVNDVGDDVSNGAGKLKRKTE